MHQQAPQVSVADVNIKEGDEPNAVVINFPIMQAQSQLAEHDAQTAATTPGGPDIPPPLAPHTALTFSLGPG